MKTNPAAELPTRYESIYALVAAANARKKANPGESLMIIAESKSDINNLSDELDDEIICVRPHEAQGRTASHVFTFHAAGSKQASMINYLAASRSHTDASAFIYKQGA